MIGLLCSVEQMASKDTLDAVPDVPEDQLEAIPDIPGQQTTVVSEHVDDRGDSGYLSINSV